MRDRHVEPPPERDEPSRRARSGVMLCDRDQLALLDHQQLDLAADRIGDEDTSSRRDPEARRSKADDVGARAEQLRRIGRRALTMQTRPAAVPVLRAIAIGAFVRSGRENRAGPKSTAPTGVKFGVRYMVTVRSSAVTIRLPLATIALGKPGPGIELNGRSVAGIELGHRSVRALARTASRWRSRSTASPRSG